jgi:DNA primase
MRGMDLALEEGLNVKLVLIPDNEDPDSYVNKVGAAAFKEFVASNKKDFILFQLDIALKDAGNDGQKKATLVNQIAATIAKINKAEDFTKQQDYIRECSQLLKIDETGLNTLVNKFIRERIAKTEYKAAQENVQSGEEFDTTTQLNAEDDTIHLLFKDELQERAVVRALLEFGLKEWTKEQRVADYLLTEIADEELFDNKSLLRLVTTYKVWYKQGIEPTPKNFLYYEDTELSGLVVSLMDFPYDISEKWKSEFEMPVPTREDLYIEEVASTLNYLKLRKIKRMIEQNQQDLGNPHTAEEQLVLIQTHQHLKQMERALLTEKGTVVLK